MTSETIDATPRGAGVAIGLPAAPDLSRYAAGVADFDLSDDQKRELLETLWSILRTMVELDIDIEQTDVCGRILSGFNAVAHASPEHVELDQSNDQTEDRAGRGAEE